MSVNSISHIASHLRMFDASEEMKRKAAISSHLADSFSDLENNTLHAAFAPRNASTCSFLPDATVRQEQDF